MEAFSVRFACPVLIALALSVCALAQDFSAPASSESTAFKLPSGARGPFSPKSLQSNEAAEPPLEELEGAKIIARVGDEVILAGDLYAQVNQFLHQRIQQIPAEQRSGLTPEILNTQRWKLIEQLLPQTVQAKLMYLDFVRTIPPDKLPEIQDSLYQAFDEQQLPRLVERANLQSAADLDKMLRSFGSSLDQQRFAFAEQLAAAQWQQKHAEDSREISHADLVDYYRTNIEDYRIPARARWEQLTARNDETGNADASYQLVGKLGNEVYRGAAFAAVAKRSSHGPTAAVGGFYDWTTKGSLRSSVLDEAIFTLPVGRLSQRIKDDDGYHIIRVVERQDEHFVPFSEAQEGIREKIKTERSQAALDEYVQQLRGSFPVWTIFDQESDEETAGPSVPFGAGKATSVARRNP